MANGRKRAQLRGNNQQEQESAEGVRQAQCANRAKPLERSRQTARDQAEAPTLPTLILGNTQPLRKLAQFAASIVPSEHYSGVARIAELEGLPITTPVVDTQAPGRLVAEAQREDGELAAKRQRTGFIERPLKDSTAAVQFQRGPRCR